MESASGTRNDFIPTVFIRGRYEERFKDFFPPRAQRSALHPWRLLITSPIAVMAIGVILLGKVPIISMIIWIISSVYGSIIMFPHEFNGTCRFVFRTGSIFDALPS
jgi:hypothetical protein